MVIHYLFECQEYAAEPFDMDRALGRYSRDLKGIMTSLNFEEDQGVACLCGENCKVQKVTRGYYR
jgi:hypothetical protein